MSDVFLSYSRKDRDLVRRLHDALVAQGRDVWVDWEDIPPTAEWLREIGGAIEGAEAVVFVLSPDSVASAVCAQELAHAVEHNKRLVPVVAREVDPAAVPEALAKLNWLFFRETDDFDGALQALVTALETDLEWVRAHTRLLTRAVEWEARGQDGSLLLRGGDLRGAEGWLGGSGQKEPRPTSLQTRFVLASRSAANRRRVVAVVAAAFALLVSVLAAVLGVVSHRRTLESRSRATASLALNQLAADPEMGLRLAAEAAQLSPTAEAVSALRRALFASRVRRVLQGHVGEVASAGFSPDGNRVVTGSSDGTARIWDLTSGEAVLRVEARGPVTEALLSPDGRLLVTRTEDGRVERWDGATGAALGEVEEAYRRPLEVLPGAVVALVQGGPGVTVLRDLVTGGARGKIHVDLERENLLALGPDGARVAVGGWAPGEPTEVRDAGGQGSPVRLETEGDAAVWAARFSPDGDRLVTVPRWVYTESGGGPTFGGEDTSARVWNAQRGWQVAELRGHDREVNSAAFSPDGGTVVTVSSDATARLWDATTGRELAVLRGHDGPVASAAFSPDGERVITAGRDGTARIWDALAGRATALAGAEVGLESAAFSPDGERVLLLDGRSARVVGSSKGEPLATVSLPAGAWLETAAFDPTGGRLVLVTGTEVLVRDAVKGEALGAFPLPPADGRPAVALSPDGRLAVFYQGDVATASGEGAPLLLDVGSGQAVARLEGHEGPVYAAAFSPDGGRIATASEDGTARLWEAATGRSLQVLRGHIDRVLGVAFRPDGRLLATASRDATAIVWDTETGDRRAVLRGHGDAVLQSAWSPDGLLLATSGGDGTIRVWEVATAAELARLGGFPFGPATIAFARGGRALRVAEGGELRSYDLGVAGGLPDLVALARERLDAGRFAGAAPSR